MSYAESLVGGVRLILWHRLELTPSFGMAIRQEIDPRGRLEPQNQVQWFRVGMTAGVMF
jgi:hypothetical protein